jgi:hypothetical protein
VLNEANAVTNGVYVWSNATAITRATDYNTVPEVEAGDFMFVTNGNAYGNTGWIQTSTVSNIGFAGNNITFTQFSGSGTYNAGTGLTLTGTTFSVNASQTQVTAVGTLGSLTVTANTSSGNLLTGGSISATGNITGGNILGGANVNATTHTGTTVSVTANVTGGNILTGGVISATGNITGGNVISGGVRVYKWTTQANTAPSGAVPGDNWYDSYADKLYLYINDGTGNVWVDQSPPTTFSSLTVAGNTSSGNLLTGGVISATGSITSAGNITGGNVLGGANVNAITHTGTTVSVSANVTGGNILTGGVISAVGNITGGNLSGTSIVGTLTTAAQTNITSLGTLGSLAVTGNTTSGNFVGTLNGSGANVTSISATNISSGTLAQARLANASLTVNGTSIALGGSGTITATATGTLTIGTGLGGTSYNGSTGVTITNTGVLSLANGGGITASASTGAITLGSTATSANTAGAIVARDASGNFTANVITATATNARYADLAELYSADAEYPSGTVVDFGGDEEVTLSVQPGSNRIAGVVSTNPAHLMNSTLESAYTVAIALTGRVPTLVIGPVSKGDMMVSAGNGYAQACAAPAMGTVIGKAVENFNGESGTIEIVVGRL